MESINNGFKFFDPDYKSIYEQDDEWHTTSQISSIERIDLDSKDGFKYIKIKNGNLLDNQKYTLSFTLNAQIMIVGGSKMLSFDPEKEELTETGV